MYKDYSFEKNFQEYQWERSNEVLNAVLPPGSSRLLELKDLYFRTYLTKADFFEVLTLTSGSFDAPWGKTACSTY